MDKQQLIKEVKAIAVISTQSQGYLGTISSEESGKEEILGIQLCAEDSFETSIKKYISAKHTGSLVTIKLSKQSESVTKTFTADELDEIEIICIRAAASINKYIKEKEAESIF